MLFEGRIDFVTGLYHGRNRFTAYSRTTTSRMTTIGIGARRFNATTATGRLNRAERGHRSSGGRR